MNEMIERVAVAIMSVAYIPAAEALRAMHKENSWPAPEGNEFVAYWTTQQAYAAISAMREPTEEMLDACRNEEDQNFLKPEALNPAWAWRAMIDAALKEG